MNVLGIGGYSHDSAAALLVDGEVVAAVAEERLSREKHVGGVPTLAVDWCLETAGLSMADIDHVGCYMRPGLRLGKRIPYRLTRAMIKFPLYSLGFAGYEVLHNAQYMYGMKQLLEKGSKTQLHWMEHHPAHAASAYLVSPFDRAALLSVDYVGEWAATWTGVGNGTQMRCLRSQNYPYSLGVFYSAITDYLGFLRASDEYKVMGLASYGKPEYYEAMKALIQPTPDGLYTMDLSWTQWPYLPGSRFGYFSKKFIDTFGPKRMKGESVTEHHENMAASAQKLLEEIVLHMANHLHQETGEKQLCLAGGVALNCAMNGRLLRETPFEDIYIQPASGDDGIAIGAAMQLNDRFENTPRKYIMNHAFLGPEYDSDAIRTVLDRGKLTYEKPDSVEERTAELLAKGKIVGWFQGRMEFGPRALGSRSILADPTRPEMKDLLNKYVKYREEFRPFAPSVLAEKAPDYFEGCTDSPFMLFVYPVKEEMKERLPAITHIDGTARVQTVTREAHARYYDMIAAFEKRRGVPVVLNTSFNVMGEPIVNTPEDAVRCFYTTGMDALVIGDFVLLK